MTTLLDILLAGLGLTLAVVAWLRTKANARRLAQLEEEQEREYQSFCRRMGIDPEGAWKAADRRKP